MRFDLAGACATLGGSVGTYHQNTLDRTAGFPTRITRSGTPSSARISNTLDASLTLDTTRTTALGDLDTAFGLKWTKASDDETRAGSVSVQSLSASLAGWTVGYTDSLMNFWSGDFQFSATAPSRSVGVVSYERELREGLKLALAVESGLPSSRQNTDGIASIDFNSPLLTARLRYEQEEGPELHLSGLVRRAEFSADPRIPFLPGTATTRTGWAVSFGATLPVPVFGEDDSFSMQATYAVDASPFLGTAVDLSSLASIVPTTGATRGWSVVGSFTHAWTETLESNVFASHLALEAQLLRAQPSVATTRLGANLYWKPFKGFRLGAEIGYLRTDIDANGVAGVFNGVSGSGVVGYLGAEWTF